MSRYLLQRIASNPDIEVHLETEISALGGDSRLKWVEWTDKATGGRSRHPIQHVFVMAGASPRTDWLRGHLALDQNGFVLTGRELEAAVANRAASWPLTRDPYILETSLPAECGVQRAGTGFQCHHERAGAGLR
ncbi:hypothetical protein [Paludibaculum fermentans]|uniref:hypothetical protein n=1 Tax=Paludibaculum fermentans TaxID=1473598 RepID=UPI003EBCAE39